MSYLSFSGQDYQEHFLQASEISFAASMYMAEQQKLVGARHRLES